MLAIIGEIGPPWGVPFVRSARVPSGISIGAFSQRSTHSMTHRWVVWRATLSITLGIPSTLVPPFFGISTARAGPGKYDPDAMRFHSRKRLSFSLSSNCSIVTPSAPAAPPLLFTFSHAAQISRLGMSCDLPDTIGSLMRLLPSGWSHQSARTAPPLRSPTHCDTQADHSYYGRVRQRAHAGTLPLAVSAARGSPAPPRTLRRRLRGAPSHVPNE